MLVRRNDETSYKRKNPWAIRRSLESVGGSGLKAKALRSGALLVETQGRGQTAALLQLTLLQGNQVTVTLADRLNGVMEIVSSDILVEMTNEELLKELQHQGVNMVQRLPSRDIVRLGPNPTLKLRFRDNNLPRSILCGYEVVAVNPWVAPLPQCRNCWDVGSHSARNCRRRIAVCGRCSQEHATDSCTADTPCCCNCGDAHPAWDRKCPVKREAAEWHRAQQRQARYEHHHREQQGPQRATWPATSPEEWPLLPPARSQAELSRPAAEADTDPSAASTLRPNRGAITAPAAETLTPRVESAPAPRASYRPAVAPAPRPSGETPHQATPRPASHARSSSLPGTSESPEDLPSRPRLRSKS